MLEPETIVAIAGAPPILVVGKALVLNLLRCVAGIDAPVALATFAAPRYLLRSRLFSRAFELPAPVKDPDGFARGLAEIGREFGPRRPVLFYDDDATLQAISRNREALSPHFVFNMPDARIIEGTLDKGKFYRLSDEFDLPVPKTRVFSPETGYAVQDPGALRFPVIIKPVSRVGWFRTELSRRVGECGKAMRIDDPAALAETAAFCAQTGTAIVVQELVEGHEDRIVSYHSYMSRSGEILGEFTGRKHRTFPVAFGMSSCVEVAELPDVRELGRELVRRTGLVGPCKLDFKRCAQSGRLYLLEINARFNLWHYPGAVAGVNLPLLAYHDLAELAPPARAPRLRRTLWVKADLDRAAVAEERRSYVKTWLGRLGKRTVYDVWWWRDPMPFLQLVADKLTVRLRQRAALW